MSNWKLFHGNLLILVVLSSLSRITAFVPKVSFSVTVDSSKQFKDVSSCLDSSKTFFFYRGETLQHQRRNYGMTFLQAISSKDEEKNSKSESTLTIDKNKEEEQQEIEQEEEKEEEVVEDDVANTTASVNDKEEKEEVVVDFDTILQTRRTINSFLPDLPNDWEQMLEKAIESAVYAPNHKRTEPWKFHLLGPKAIRKVCELNASIVSDKKGVKAGEKKLKRWLQMPGWLVVTCQTNNSTDGSSSSSSSMEDPASIEREDYAACCCAVQNLCLSLHHAGMGTKWTTGPVNFDSRFSDIVGLETNEYVVGTIWFGTPETVPEPPNKKKSTNKVLIKHD